MIHPAEWVGRPFRERDLLPEATDAQTIQYFQERIEGIRREVKSPIRAPHLRHANSLLHMSGEEKYSLVYGRLSSFDRLVGLPKNQLRVERGRGQELLFKVMGAYGFNQNISHPRLKYKYDDKQVLVIGRIDPQKWVEDITERPDGTTREVLLYPSQTTKGLVFERVRDVVTETKETTDVWWNVVDEGPLLNIKNTFSRSPKPQITP